MASNESDYNEPNYSEPDLNGSDYSEPECSPNPPTPTTPSTPDAYEDVIPKAPEGSSATIILRDWPKVVMMIPTLVAAMLCGILMAFYSTPIEADAPFEHIHYIGLFFLLVLAINLTMLLYDLSLRGFVIVALAFVAILLGLSLLNIHWQGKVWTAIARALSVRVWANSAFYFTFALVLLTNLGIAWIVTRFNYWKVENNEIIIHSGFMQEQERHPTAQARFKLVIEDIAEYGLMGAGKLVFYFGDNNSQRELTTVLRVHHKAKMLDELLGRVAVVER